MEKKIRRVVYTYEPLKLNFNSTLLRNAVFHTDLGINEDGLPAFWVRQSLGLDKAQAAIIDDEIWLALFGEGGDAIDSTKYVENVVDNIFVQSTDVMGFSAGYRYIFENRDVNTDGVYNVAIRVRLTNNSTSDVYELTNTGWVLFTGGYSIVNAMTTPEGDKVEFGEDSPPFTGDAKLEFRIHGLYPFIGTGTDQALVAFDSFAGYYRDSSDSPLTSLVTEVEEVDSINEESQFDIKAFHGDGPEYPCNGSFRLSDDSVT
ncbi:MAG: hypothetical protein GWN64_00415, partial [Candidatus Thorarchaeota archaeon]|nr:hypothetical protein [Candidatus Thorarchaeota archaeon]